MPRHCLPSTMAAMLGQGAQAKKDRIVFLIVLQAPRGEVLPRHPEAQPARLLTACCLQGCLPGCWRSH